MAGCEFNRELEIDKYIENKSSFGERYARQYLKTNMAHYRAKESGKEIPSWDVRVSENGLATDDGVSLLDLTQQPLISQLADRVSSEIKERVPVEMETVRYANDLALRGAETIILPEHVSKNGVLSVGFVTVYQKDAKDPSLYHGSQIPLGENLTVDSARNLMKKMFENTDSRFIQSRTHEGAFAIGIEKSDRVEKNVVTKSLFNNRSNFSDYNREVDSNRSPYEPFSASIKDITKSGQAIVTEMVTTATIARRFLVERLRKTKQPQKKSSQENHIKEKIKRLQRRRVISRERFGLRWSERKPIEKRKNKKEVKFHNERIHESKITTSSEPLSSKELNRVFPTEREKPRIEKRLRKEKTVVFTTQLRVEQKKMFTEKRERKQEKTKRYLHRKEIKQHKKEFKAKLSVHAKENRFLERVSVTKKEKMLLKMVKKLVKRLEGPEKKVKKSNGESQVQPATEVRKNEKKKVAVLRFSIALVLWLLIEKRGKVEDLKVSQKEKFQETTHLAKQEPRPWILLSIIWHLAAIREFGLAKPIAKKKKIKKLLTLPANGIIFARAS